uniref:DHFR domain-containing protein n=1 Tax=Oryza rufipogon TaxID=4529 RepID=A0A0E0RGW8_ORYRU
MWAHAEISRQKKEKKTRLLAPPPDHHLGDSTATARCWPPPAWFRLAAPSRIWHKIRLACVRHRLLPPVRLCAAIYVPPPVVPLPAPSLPCAAAPPPALPPLRRRLCSFPPVRREPERERLRERERDAREKSNILILRLQSLKYLEFRDKLNFSRFHKSQVIVMSTNVNNGNSESNLKRSYQVVVSATRDMGIGKDGTLPWKLPGDLKFFKDITVTTSDPSKKNAVVMGRKTWESIPLKFRPLPGRLNVILTRSGSFDFATAENVVICGSLDSALQLLATTPYCLTVEKTFIIGGGEILRQSLNAPACEAIHLTDIESSIECDTFIPPIDLSMFHPWYSSFPVVENGIKHSFISFVRVTESIAEANDSSGKELTGNDSKKVKFEIENFSFLPKMIFERHEEYQYLNLVQDIIRNGAKKNDRTGTGTVSKFGCQMRFNLRRNFPLLTTKRVFWRGVLEELLWFISGSTNAKVLQEKGIHIWDGNASRQYLDRYTDMHADYVGKGFDQLMDVIDKIKNNPDDRRIILSAWNPTDLKKMALPPCHMFAQFYVENGELSCQMYQRSADMGLGVPFNIASYSLLTCMIAQVCDLSPGDFVHVIGDAHVYRTHVEALEEQMRKQPKPFPILKINPVKKDIDSFVTSDFKLVRYDPHHKIEMKMAV